MPASAQARREVHRRTAPVHPRRVSGPARPRVTPPPARGRTDAFERLKALPDHRLVDRLLRGRAWIWVIGIMLGGIVAVQVSLLKLNAGISRAVEATGTLQRQNAALESEIARLDSGERIRAAAVRAGMVDPSAGDTKYLTARGPRDATLAARRMQPPSATAQAVMANHGHAPGTTVTTVNPLVAATQGTAAPAAGAATTGAAATTSAGAATTGAAATTSAGTTPTGTTGAATTGATGTTGTTGAATTGATGTTGTTGAATTGTAGTTGTATPAATATPTQPVG